MTDTLPPLADTHLSVNALTQSRVQRLLNEAESLNVKAIEDPTGVCIVDAGIEARSSIAAGLLIGEICMGGLGDVTLRTGVDDGWPTWVQVRSAQPVLSCLGSQYAGWSLAATKEETGGKKFFSLGSGPARALAGKEALYAELTAAGFAGLVAKPVAPHALLQAVYDVAAAPQAISSPSTSERLWPASASKASEPVMIPATASTATKAMFSPAPMAKARP